MHLLTLIHLSLCCLKSRLFWKLHPTTTRKGVYILLYNADNSFLFCYTNLLWIYLSLCCLTPHLYWELPQATTRKGVYMRVKIANNPFLFCFTNLSSIYLSLFWHLVYFESSFHQEREKVVKCYFIMLLILFCYWVFSISFPYLSSDTSFLLRAPYGTHKGVYIKTIKRI